MSMSLQRTTSYFDSERSYSSEKFDETYFDKLRLILSSEIYSEISIEDFRLVLSNIGSGSLKSLNSDQVKEIIDELTKNSIQGKVDHVIWNKLFCFWLRKDTRAKAVLLAVDVQNDFISGSLALKNCPLGEDGAEIVPLINDSRRHFKTVLFTKDWHPANHCSFASNAHKYTLHSESAPLLKDPPDVMTTIMYDLQGKPVEQVLWPDHCVQGTVGAELHDDLQVNPCDEIILKGTSCAVDSYSAFWDNGKGLQTNLFCRLIDQGITTVFCCGLAYDICVKFTVLDAAEHGFQTYIIKDLCRCISHEGACETAIRLKEANAEEITSDQVEAVLKQEGCL